MSSDPIGRFIETYPFLFGIILYVAVSYFISLISGWRTLSKFYLSNRPFEGGKIGFVSAGMRFGANYGGCIKIGVTKDGLFLSTIIIFRLFHPTLFIQWKDISFSDKKIFLFKHKKLNFNKCPNVPFIISAKVFNKIFTIKDNLIKGIST